MTMTAVLTVTTTAATQVLEAAVVLRLPTAMTGVSEGQVATSMTHWPRRGRWLVAAFRWNMRASSMSGLGKKALAAAVGGRC